MADALITPAVGGTAWAATAATTVYCARKVRLDAEAAKVPLMGVLGAFVFAAQMINFQIPGTGSSGHIGGGLLLAVLLGPEAAFLVIASVLSVQALFFADGGLLALGCNILNLGVFPAFVAYPLLYRPLVGERASALRIAVASVVAGIVGLELGALGVVMQTTFSGISSLPFGSFAVLMTAIHLAIGTIEGVVTAAVVLFVKQAQPELLAQGRPEGRGASTGRPSGASRGQSGGVCAQQPAAISASARLIAAFAIAALVLGGGLSYFASENPDGLEWSIARVSGSQQFAEGATSRLHDAARNLQARTALFPDYAARRGDAQADAARAAKGLNAADGPAAAIGLALVAAIAALAAWWARAASRRERRPAE